MSRLRNYGLWVSIFAFIGLLCQTFNIVKLPANYNELVNTLLGILVLFGILNNPTTPNRGFVVVSNIKSGFKNYGLWLSLFAFIGVLFQTFNIVKLPDNYNELVNALLGILVFAGIINNPTTTNRWYLDD